jgi:repressor of nif and glnA expression
MTYISFHICGSRRIYRMRLLKKAHTSQRRLIEILRVIDEAKKPIGAKAISERLSSRGYEIGERAVRYNLKILDEFGFTKKHGYSGRVLTQLGMKELSDALVGDRIGFVNTRIDEYMYRTTFDTGSLDSNVIINTSFIDKADHEATADILRRVVDSGYTVSRRVLYIEEGERIASLEVPDGCLAICTVCSITIDGMLLRCGIPVNTSFAGVVDVQDGNLRVFTDLIAYAGSSLDPMKVFMTRRMTRVNDAVTTGAGKILANVREIPLAAANEGRKLLEQAKAEGIDGLIKIGEPGEPILGCPVGPGKIGIALFAGVNGAVAVEESGIRIRTTPISALVDYSKMTAMV